MTCQDYKHNYKDLMMGYLDDELTEEQKQIFENHLKTCIDCTEELEEFKKLKQITENVTLIEPEDRLFQQYWGNIYNRMERGIGWILFAIAAVVLIIYGGFKAIEEIINDPTVEITLKIALLILLAGLAVLFVSVLRERIFFWKSDRYKDVRR